MDLASNDVILRVERLKQYFKTGLGGEFKAVDDVSFEIRRGEVFGLVGESGCGKTTTGRAIIGLHDITGGDIWFMGRHIAVGVPDMKKRIGQARRSGNRAQAEGLSEDLRRSLREVEDAKKHKIITKMQMIFQDPAASLNPRMTVREIIAEGLAIRGVRDKRIVNEAVFRSLDMVGLAREHAERYPHEFSGGQRQRVGIARSLVLEPELIIADEPVSALDASIQIQIINLLNELRGRMRLALLFIAHDLSVVKYFSDRVAVMYCGKLVELADSGELFARPLHPYTRALLSSVPLPDPYYEKRRKRLVYVPALDHDYGAEQPRLREVFPGHYVSCGSAEYDKYKAL